MSVGARQPAESGLADDRARRALGVAGLVALVAASAALVAPGPGLVPAASTDAPGWLLGVFGRGWGIGAGLYYGLLWTAFAAYLCVLLAAPTLSHRLVLAVAALLLAAFALAAPLLSQDVFSYIAYARLGALHDLNPYTHAPLELPDDPVLARVGWTESPSAYGPLFTLIAYPLAHVSVPVALWTLKAAAALSVLAMALLVARLAPARGIDPRRGFVLVALNPLVLVHVVGGAHNDAIAMLLALGGCAAVLALREASGGFAIVVAAGLKLSAAFAAPFALLGAARRGRWIAGAAAGATAIGAVSLLAFGPHALDSVGLVGENQGRVSNYSVPNLTSELLGIRIGAVRAFALAAYLASLAALLLWVWRGADWVRAAGWAALGLLLATAWLLPWYLIWALPFAALSRDRRLVAAVLGLTAVQLAARVPL